MSIQATTASIVKKAQKDPEAFADIYNLFFDRIYRYIYLRTSHKETAEDLCEEVFLKAYESLPLLKNPEIFSPWLYQIAKNLVIDYYRKTKSIPIEDMNDLPVEILTRKDKVTIDQNYLLQTLAKLPEEQRQVIKMRYLEDLPYDVISKYLGKSEVNIRVIQHRAIKKLKELYEH